MPQLTSAAHAFKGARSMTTATEVPSAAVAAQVVIEGESLTSVLKRPDAVEPIRSLLKPTTYVGNRRNG